MNLHLKLLLLVVNYLLKLLLHLLNLTFILLLLLFQLTFKIKFGFIQFSKYLLQLIDLLQIFSLLNFLLLNKLLAPFAGLACFKVGVEIRMVESDRALRARKLKFVQLCFPSFRHFIFIHWFCRVSAGWADALVLDTGEAETCFTPVAFCSTVLVVRGFQHEQANWTLQVLGDCVLLRWRVERFFLELELRFHLIYLSLTFQ